MNTETIEKTGIEWLTQLAWIPSGFVRPWVLWLLVVPMLLLLWIWLRRSRGVPLPVDFSPHPGGLVTKTLINIAESIPPVLLAIVIWMLAGPMELGRPVAQRSLTNIQFCVDISGSMTASFGEGNRYDASMEAINQFLDFREGDAFGITFFGNSVLHWTPLTTDSDAIRCAVPFMRPEVVPPWFGGTEIGKALKECQVLLNQKETGDKMIILVSDGQSADLFGGQAQSLAKKLFDDNIHVYAIHIANGSAPPEITTITTYTEGQVFAPEDPSALEAVFEQIDAMEKAKMERTIAEQLDNFKPYSLISLLLLLWFIGTAFGLRYTPW